MIVVNPKYVEIFTPPAPPYSSNIGKVKDDEAGMDVDIMEKNDFKKQVEALRWLGENSRSPGDW